MFTECIRNYFAMNLQLYKVTVLCLQGASNKKIINVALGKFCNFEFKKMRRNESDLSQYLHHVPLYVSVFLSTEQNAIQCKCFRWWVTTFFTLLLYCSFTYFTVCIATLSTSTWFCILLKATTCEPLWSVICRFISNLSSCTINSSTCQQNSHFKWCDLDAEKLWC